jgi:RNA polymerase sigma factor (sigma-70 family)
VAPRCCWADASASVRAISRSVGSDRLITVIPFQRFLDAHRNDVWRFAVAAVGREDADDVFQETFLAALRAWPKRRSSDNLRAWVLTIAANKATDHHRAHARGPTPTEHPPERAVSDPEPADDALWTAVRALPPKQRAAITLRYAADLDYAAIGVALHCSADAARRSAHEGLQKLRRKEAA